MISFIVFGHPAPQGSMRSFAHPKTGKIITKHSNGEKLLPWRQQVAMSAMCEMGEMDPTDEAVTIRMRFYFARPKSLHKCRLHKTTKPDLDKLGRTILDALTGVVWDDDAQVVEIYKLKLFGQPERVEIELDLTPDPQPPTEGAPPVMAFSAQYLAKDQ